MTGEAVQRLPDPTQERVAFWLSQLSPEELHDSVWIQVNRRFHGIVMAARAYANAHYADQPEAKTAYFDGLTIALGSLVDAADLAQVRAMFVAPIPEDP